MRVRVIIGNAQYLGITLTSTDIVVKRFRLLVVLLVVLILISPKSLLPSFSSFTKSQPRVAIYMIPKRAYLPYLRACAL